MSGPPDHAISATRLDARGNASRPSPGASSTIPHVMDFAARQDRTPAPDSPPLLADLSSARSQTPHLRSTESNPRQRVGAPTLEAKDIELASLTWTPDPPVAPKAVQSITNIYDHTVSQCESLRTLIIDGELVRFTPTEYRLLIPILDAYGKAVPFRHLTTGVLAREPDRDARRLLDKHIDHIRSKLRPFGLNVHCVARFGYLLLADE